jgi:hypothetical protein
MILNQPIQHTMSEIHRTSDIGKKYLNASFLFLAAISSLSCVPCVNADTSLIKEVIASKVCNLLDGTGRKLFLEEVKPPPTALSSVASVKANDTLRG